MPRRRMISPDFWGDVYVAKLVRDERLFLLGCISNADDEGRLKGHPAYLKAAIFMYDEDITLERMSHIRDSTLKKMALWPSDNPWLLAPYSKSEADYLYFPAWYQHQAPTHAQPSQLPVPPTGPSLDEPFTDRVRQEIYERDSYICQYCGRDLAQSSRSLSIDHVIPIIQGGSHNRANLVTACKSCNLKKHNRNLQEADMSLIATAVVNLRVNLEVNPKVNQHVQQSSLGQSSLGQSSQGKVRIGKSSAVQEDFTKFVDSENDLTDALMTTLTKNISAGRAQVLAAEGRLGELSPEMEDTLRMNWGIPVLKKCWKDGIGEEITNAIFDGARKALKQYPLEVVAKAFAKGVRYKGGKHKSWKYIQTIIDEEVEKRGRSPPH